MRERSELDLSARRSISMVWPAGAAAGKRLVDDDAGKPSAQSGLAAEGVEIAEGADVGLLQRVFSLAIISHDAACGIR